MAEVTLSFGSIRKPADEVTPAAQASIDAETVVTGSELDASVFSVLSYTVKNTGANAIDITTYGANASDFSDEVLVDTMNAIAAAAIDSYVVDRPPYRYYRCKVAADSGGSQGAATLRGVAR